MTRFTAIIAAFLVVAPQVAAAQGQGQGLADVAKAEEARRKTVKKAGKTYTNTSLKPDFTVPTSSGSPTGDAYAAPTAGGGTPTPGAAPGNTALSPDPANASASIAGVPGNEAQWKGRMLSARTALERSRMFSEALQSRINALTTDVVNRDDPYQRQALEAERQKALAELERVKREMADQTLAISNIEDEARRAGVPPGWLR